MMMMLHSICACLIFFLHPAHHHPSPDGFFHGCVATSHGRVGYCPTPTPRAGVPTTPTWPDRGCVATATTYCPLHRHH